MHQRDRCYRLVLRKEPRVHCGSFSNNLHPVRLTPRISHCGRWEKRPVVAWQMDFLCIQRVSYDEIARSKEKDLIDLQAFSQTALGKDELPRSTVFRISRVTNDNMLVRTGASAPRGRL